MNEDLDQVIAGRSGRVFLISLSRAAQVKLGLAPINHPGVEWGSLHQEVQDWLNKSIKPNRRKVAGYERYHLTTYSAFLGVDHGAEFRFWRARDAVLFKMFWL